jgi:hypothetical protein
MVDGRIRLNQIKSRQQISNRAIKRTEIHGKSDAVK